MQFHPIFPSSISHKHSQLQQPCLLPVPAHLCTTSFLWQYRRPATICCSTKAALLSASRLRERT